MTDIENRYLNVKRRLFEKCMSDLNDRQKQAVFTVNGPLLVIAGAGSGKTTVLVRRIAQIIRYGNAYLSDYVPTYVNEETVAAYEAALELGREEIQPILGDFAEKPCAPWNMLAITFTNKAANEIKERLGSIFGDENLSGSIWTGTFHSVCMRIIRADPQAAGVAPGVTIYDSDDSKKLLTAIIKELNIDEKQFSVKTVANEISRAKDRLLTPEAYSEKAGGFREKVFSTVYTEYRNRLEKSNALDFDDIIMRTVFMLRGNEQIRQKYAAKFKYVCVDEYQDTNVAQFELCRLLASGSNNIMVVGDDDQSIYRFRGATVENILSFDNTWKNAAIIKLEQNYRSTSNILNAANAVIAKNPTRREKTLWTENGNGEKIYFEKCEDENEEARRITDIIQKAVAEKKHSFRDFAVLYRVNAQSNTIERTFAKSAVPYRVYGGTRFNDRKEIKDVVAYLQLVVNPSDRVRLKRIINEPKRTIGDVTVAAVESLSNETGLTMPEIMEHSGDYLALSRAKEKLTAFAAMLKKLQQIYAEGCPLDSFINQVLDITGYRNMLILGGEAEKDRLDNVNEFVSGAIEYMSRTEEPTLEGFLEENSLVADVDGYDENADAVVLMTIHSAKGLEFPVTILPGMEEGIFPGPQSIIEPKELEEERRLAYVAITRAKQELYITCASRRLLYGRTSYNDESRFVKDIPAQYIYKKEKPKRNLFSDEDDGYNPWGGGRTYYSEDYGSKASKATSVSVGKGTNYGPKKSSGTVYSPTVTGKIRTDVQKFKEGDRVLHPTFGAGEIMTAKPMGSDVLYEIIFDTAGTKKLMGSFAKLTAEEKK